MFKRTSNGERRHEIQLQAPDSPGFGQRPVYTTYLTTWAKIENVQADERFADRQYLSIATHQVNLAYPPGVAIHSNHRVLFGKRVLDVKAVINRDERNIEIDLLCLELADGAPTGV